MAFDKYKDGAHMEPENTVGKHIDGAWEDCEAAKRVKDGAWAEVWANIKWLTKLSNNITAGMCTVSEGGLEIEFFKFMDAANGYGTISGGGTMVLYLDGEWTNPTISFDFEGGFTSRAEQGTGDWRMASAGAISLYSRTTGGAVATKEVVTRVGATQSNPSYVAPEEGSYEGVLEGTFNRLGLSIYVSGFSGNFYNADLTLIVKNLRINGRKIGFPDSVEFDNQDWGF